MSKILLIEDSTTQAEQITRCLEKQGLSVMGVGSSEEAQLRLTLTPFSLID